MVFIKHNADITMDPFTRRLFAKDVSFGELFVLDDCEELR